VEGNGPHLIDIHLRNLPGETEEYHENLRITDVPAEIRTEYLPNTSVERYRYNIKIVDNQVVGVWIGVSVVQRCSAPLSISEASLGHRSMTSGVTYCQLRHWCS
jgi:hypothetical protein